MAQLQILHFPDPRLRKKAVPVDTVDNSIRTLIDDMFETMYTDTLPPFLLRLHA